MRRNGTVRPIVLGLVAVITAAITVAAVAATWPGPGRARPDDESGLVRGGPFSLVDHTGREVDQDSYPGSFLLLFFGYTHCPDVCPSGLAIMSRALVLLGQHVDHVQPIFITFDPARDTAERLAEYLSHFDERIVGLTGSKEQAWAAASRYGVDVSATYAADQPGSSYSMSHSAYTYLVAPDGTLRMMFRDGITAGAMATSIGRAVEAWDRSSR